MIDRFAAPLTRIALLSTLILFLEMLLVRWLGTELRVFAYLQNGVLVAAFLGLGLGARNARQPVRLLPLTRRGAGARGRGVQNRARRQLGNRRRPHRHLRPHPREPLEAGA